MIFPPIWLEVLLGGASCMRCCKDPEEEQDVLEVLVEPEHFVEQEEDLLEEEEYITKEAEDLLQEEKYMEEEEDLLEEGEYITEEEEVLLKKEKEKVMEEENVMEEQEDVMEELENDLEDQEKDLEEEEDEGGRKTGRVMGWGPSLENIEEEDEAEIFFEDLLDELDEKKHTEIDALQEKQSKKDEAACHGSVFGSVTYFIFL
ncbi:golgin subfamily A member 6-like protein 25 [Anopheles ziemanni]|uniref:golgin subfamily A member 6-like protein 25 n=1 Tax=Anopheles coustani TaxID=139045 RepID=UPI002659E3A8|nr:golgin subfamily A member 6-like protein 25 [Anopheles coustani]XP_058177632.1 golgin subfamily A member 6-like protein 25 [Anopheles ziemanni]